MVRAIDIAWAAGFLEGEGCPHWSKGPAINATQVLPRRNRKVL